RTRGLCERRIESKFTEQPRRRQPRIPFDGDFRPRAGCVESVHICRAVQRQRLARILAPVERFERQPQQFKMMSVKLEFRDQPRPQRLRGFTQMPWCRRPFVSVAARHLPMLHSVFVRGREKMCALGRRYLDLPSKKITPPRYPIPSIALYL